VALRREVVDLVRLDLSYERDNEGLGGRGPLVDFQVVWRDPLLAGFLEMVMVTITVVHVKWCAGASMTTGMQGLIEVKNK
jgi:hypothetical protein